MSMESTRISDIEDYCRTLPSRHTWNDLSVPTDDVAVIEQMIQDYDTALESGLTVDIARRQIQRAYKRTIKPSHFNTIYQKMLAESRIGRSIPLENALITKACRGISGVTVVTVFLSPYPDGQAFSCKWNCSYCPNEPGQPRSYLFGEPGVLRANQFGFDCIQQMRNRIEAYRVNGHPTDKFEVLVLGGTIHSYPASYLENFMRDIYYGANTCNSNNDSRTPLSLKEEQVLNTTGEHKVIGLTVETRPDCITMAELVRFRSWGVTRVQLGVQHTDDEILRKVNRGCGHKHTLAAMKLLRDNCFKVDIHLMPNLPGSTPDKDRAMFDTVLSDLHPDQVKVYPCETTPFTKILEDYKLGLYIPYSNEELMEVVIYWKTHVHPWIRNNRIVRDIPNYYIVAGVPSSSERCVYQDVMKRRGLVCRCIRCREAGRHPAGNVADGRISVDTYEVAGGTEKFISWESGNGAVLYGFCRLRLPSDENSEIFPELKDLALIRELHVYGRTFATGTDATNASTGGIAAAQHIGLGKKLMRMAQFLAWRNGYVGTAVIAGIGTQGYYARLGYALDGGQGGFMIKRWAHIEINMLFHITLGLLACVIAFTITLLWNHLRD